ncbi:hypothetical protein [Nonomuraea salmonea]|uniref:hypothetical protein n=1 Tax=Nonomuraea salmonea TaxID=46181 RepID=UPI002FEB0CC6
MQAADLARAADPEWERAAPERAPSRRSQARTPPGSGTNAPGSGATAPGSGTNGPGSGASAPGSGASTAVPGTNTSVPGKGTPAYAGSGPIPTDPDHAMVRVVDNLFRNLDKLELAVAQHRLFAEDPVSLRTLAHKMLVEREALSLAQRTAEERVLQWLRSSESAPVTGHMFRLTEWLGAAATEDQLIGADPAHPVTVPSLRTPLWRVLVTLMPDRRLQDGWLVVGDMYGLQARTRQLLASAPPDADVVELMSELGIRAHSAKAWLDALPPGDQPRRRGRCSQPGPAAAPPHPPARTATTTAAASPSRPPRAARSTRRPRWPPCRRCRAAARPCSPAPWQARRPRLPRRCPARRPTRAAGNASRSPRNTSGAARCRSRRATPPSSACAPAPSCRSRAPVTTPSSWSGRATSPSSTPSSRY